VLLRRMLRNERMFNLNAENCYQPPAEQLCNEFAGMLLMPEELVRECWDMVRVHRGGIMACASWFGVTEISHADEIREVGIIARVSG
jgi:Zn-dependent peptidase ImmA (M78 family)